MKAYKNFIGGRWISSNSKETFDSLDPATEVSIGKFQDSNGLDVELAVEAAEKSFQEWSDFPAPKRAEFLFRIRDLLIENKERLARLEVKEMGKVYKEALGDVQEAIDIFEYMAGEGRRLFGFTTPSELKNKFCATIRRPIGIVALITPWNFPIAIPSWKLAPALICGNSVILKPSSDTPLCAIELVKILNEAGIPKGVVNLITGSGNTVGTSLVTHQKIHAVSFTGSVETGKFITKNAGLKKIGLELGGKNAIIIMEDANLELALEGVLWGAFGTTGQRCTAASRIIIHETVAKKFENMLINSTKKLRLGSGLSKTTDIGPLINRKAVEKSDYYTNLGLKEGAKLLIGGKPLSSKGFFYQPTIFTNVNHNMRIAQEEIFGPVLSIIKIKNIDEAIEVCNNIKQGLSSSIYTENMQYAFKAINKIDSGITYINSSTIGAEVHLPFGGVKETGNGTREAGWTGIEEFSEIKTIYLDYSDKLQKAQGITD
ncbi:aldehyde dehydrogenase family protein [Candidatus Woesearchaeota archaeon]|nr:aldehyde dehydrogenase family protein [Candidatus Woesearchaeota archaeon]